MRDFLKKHTIPKKVDSGNSSLQSEVPVPVVQSQEIPTTASTLLVTDLINKAQSAISNVDLITTDIKTTNNIYPEFQTYSQIVEANAFSPMTLINNPLSTPPKVYTPAQLTFAEQAVYRSSIDPRAAHYDDLFRIREGLESSLYVLQTLWVDITNPNNLYDGLSDDNLVRYALFKERDKIDAFNAQASQIGSTKLQQISINFIRGLLYKVAKNTMSSSTQVDSKLSELIRTLDQMRHVLQISLIFQNDNWKILKSHIVDIVGHSIQQIGQRLITTQAQAIIGGIRDSIDGLTNNIETFIDETGDPDLYEFRLQVDAVFQNHLKKIEDDYLHTQRVTIESDNVRTLLLSNSLKASKTKQYIYCLGVMVSLLQSTQAELVRSGSFSLEAAEKLVQIVNSSLRTRNTRLISSQPPASTG